MEKLKLVWLTKNGNQTNFEKEYIEKRLFANYQCVNIRKKDDLIHRNAIIIFSCNTEEPSKEVWQVVKWYEESNTPYCLLHLSDERCVFNPSYYKNAKHVWRSYGHSKYNLPNVSIVPLGFQSGFMNEDRELHYERNLNISFAGSIKQDRQYMVDQIKEVEYTFVKSLSQFNDPRGLPINGMIELYKNTLLVPCPMGWSHVDSFRIMEALEWGAIPVIKNCDREYFDSIYPENPFLKVDDWAEMKLFLENDLTNRRTCIKNTFNYYTWFINKLKISVKTKYESIL